MLNPAQSAAEGAITPYQIVRSGRNTIQADLNRQSGKVQFAQSCEVCISQQHGIGLENDLVKPERTGKLHYFEPVRVAERLTTGNPDPLPSNDSEFFQETPDGPKRHVRMGCRLTCLDPAMATFQVAGTGDGKRQYSGRTQAGQSQRLQEIRKAQRLTIGNRKF